MKKALRLILMYLIFLIVGVLIGSVVYLLFQNVLGFVAGRTSTVFEGRNFLLAFIFISECLIFLICPLISYYKIRHTSGISAIITYVVLCLLTWGLLFPLLIQLDKKYVNQMESEIEVQALSGGYFRRIDDRIYYFSDDLPATDKELSVPMFVIDTSEGGNIEQIRGGKNSALYKQAYPFRDVLIRDNFQYSNSFVPVDFHFLIDRAIYSWNKGFSFWLGYLSLGLVLCTVYGLASIFAWRLVNAVACFCGVFVALAFNTLYYSPLFESFRALPFLSNPAFVFLEKYIDEPFVCIVNVAVSLLFVLFAIIKVVSAKMKKD